MSEDRAEYHTDSSGRKWNVNKFNQQKERCIAMMSREINRCPHCKGHVIMFDADNDYCEKCKKILLPSETACSVKDTLMRESMIGDESIIKKIEDVSRKYRDKGTFVEIVKDLSHRGLVRNHALNCLEEIILNFMTPSDTAIKEAERFGIDLNVSKQRLSKQHEATCNKFLVALKNVDDALRNHCQTCEYSCMSWPNYCNDGCNIHIALGIANKALEGNA